MTQFIPYVLKILTYGIGEEIVQGDIYESEILCEELGDQMRYIYLKPWKYSFLFSGEPFHHEPRPYTMVFCGNNAMICDDKEKCVLLPYFYFAFNLYKDFESYKPVKEVPSKFCCAVVSNPYNQFRNSFIKTLVDLNVCDSYGKICNNMGVFDGDMLQTMQQYKFNICFENSEHEAYITEKLPNALKAGIIPVYMGAPTVTKYFNKNRILVLKDTSDESIFELVQKMRFIAENPELYLKIVNQPILPEGELPITLESLGQQVRSYLLKKDLLPK